MYFLVMVMSFPCELLVKFCKGLSKTSTQSRRSKFMYLWTCPWVTGAFLSRKLKHFVFGLTLFQLYFINVAVVRLVSVVEFLAVIISSKPFFAINWLLLQLKRRWGAFFSGHKEHYPVTDLLDYKIRCSALFRLYVGVKKFRSWSLTDYVVTGRCLGR